MHIFTVQIKIITKFRVLKKALKFTIMKKLFYFLSFGVLLGTLAMIGCSNDDDDGPTIEEQQINALEGTWTHGW